MSDEFYTMYELSQQQEEYYTMFRAICDKTQETYETASMACMENCPLGDCCPMMLTLDRIEEVYKQLF